MAATIEAKFETVVNKTFAAHSFANARFVKQIDSTLLENTGTDAIFYVMAAARFQDDRVDPLKMQKMRKEEACGAGADDSYLCVRHLCECERVKNVATSEFYNN